MLTLAQLLQGKKEDSPPAQQVDVTFKKAPELTPKATVGNSRKIVTEAKAESGN
jgi:hypothetical protein